MNDQEKVDEAKKLLQEWIDKQGHDRCWYYPDIFRKLINLFDITSKKERLLPPLEEFKQGCKRYQEKEYKRFHK